MSINHQNRMFHSSEHRIMRLLDHGKLPFHELLKNTWGIYPGKLLKILEGLESDKIVKRVNDCWEIIQGQTVITKPENKKTKKLYLSEECFKVANKKMDEFRKEMPEPHPHNFDWRFSNQCLQSFAEYLLSYHDDDDNICIIAAPSLFVYLQSMDYFNEIILIERSKQMNEKIRHIFPGFFGIKTHDLQYPFKGDLSRLENYFSCIIADPPWYQDYYELFLSRAKDIVKPGGLIHLALFPPFSKKSALRERTAIFSFAQNNGIDLIELKSGLLKYETPLFERSALKSEEFQVQPEKWRRGDLATFYVTSKTGQNFMIQVEEGVWKEFIFDKKVIKLRHKDPVRNWELPEIINIIDGDGYYPSVSRKHPLRNKIDLWTSGNKAYEVKGSYVLEIILNGIINKESLEKIFIEISREFVIDLERFKKELEELYKRLIEIIEREFIENG